MATSPVPPGTLQEFPARPPGTWRIATWNVLWGPFGPEPGRRLAGVETTLRAVDADVVCLQEVYSDVGGADDAAGLGDRLGYESTRTAARAGDHRSLGNAVLSRWGITDRGEVALPDADGTAGRRRALWATVEGPSGRQPVISTHLAYRFDESAVRQLQVVEVARLADRLRSHPERGAPVVVCGDLNAVPDSDEIRALTGRRAAPLADLVFQDCWPQVSDEPGHTWVRRNPHLADASWPGRRIDYVLVSWPRPTPWGNPVQAFLIGDGPLDGIWPSDHLGVVADLRLDVRGADRGAR